MNGFVLLSATSFICFTHQILDSGYCDATNWTGLHRDPNKQLSHGQFKEHFYHVLDVPKIEEFAVQRGSQCMLKCLNNDHCFSTNVGAFHLPDGNISCELLPADKYNASEKFKANHTFHHYSIRSPCESFPCQHGGTCRALYETDDYRCTCKPTYYSKNCAENAVALYPLNRKYGTRELENGQPQGTPVGVSLAPGPNGKTAGSYQFTGQANSYIEFPNNGGLDTQRSITMLCWLYPQNTDGPIFNYKTSGSWGVHMWVESGKLFTRFTKRDYQLTQRLITSTSLTLNQWQYVGASYDHNTGIASLWLDGQQVVHTNIGAGLSLGTQDDVRMGAKEGDRRYLRGQIAAMQIYDVALTEEQVNAVKNAGQER